MSIEPLLNSKFQLDLSGVAGFFGGDAAVSAMSTVHLYHGRKWLGWYNMPGSYEIARRYGRLASSRFWDGMFPGVCVDPAELLELGGEDGPPYRGLHSGTVLKKTGRVAYTLFRYCNNIEAPGPQGEGKDTPTVAVTIVDLRESPHPPNEPQVISNHATLFAVIPILSTICTAVACGFYRDWYCFAMILLGAASGGLSCYVLGSGTLHFTYPKASPAAPPGHGLLQGEASMVVLLGHETVVNAVTKGVLSLNFHTTPKYDNIGFCSLLLTVQFILQLLLVPQGRLFGQLMFLSSLFVSWAYNMFLCSIEPEDAQQTIVMGTLLPHRSTTKHLFRKRTEAVVFALACIIKNSEVPVEKKALEACLRSLLPDDTTVWKIWHAWVITNILYPMNPSPPKAPKPEDPGPAPGGPGINLPGEKKKLEGKEKALLEALMSSAESASRVVGSLYRRESFVTG